jgi:GT2 family glycosyltransferase
MTEKIYILLPVHNRREITRHFIQCLRTQTYSNYHLVLIDDGSTDNTAEMVLSYLKNVTVIKGTGNWWWAGSLQQGYLWLKARDISPSDLVLIINDDTEFQSDFLHNGLTILSRSKKSLLLAQCFSKQTDQLIDAGIRISWNRFSFDSEKNSEKINCLSTRGLFLRYKDFLTIGGFYPWLLPHYTSDYEFTIRAFRKGLMPLVDSELKLWLDEFSTGDHNFNELKEASIWKFLQSYFSKKSALNPVYLIVFVALCCPWKWKVLNWLRICKAAFLQTFLSSSKKYCEQKSE